MDQDASSNSRSHPEGVSATEVSTPESNDETATNGSSDDVTTPNNLNDVTVPKVIDDDETLSNVVFGVSTLGSDDDTTAKVLPCTTAQAAAGDITRPNAADDVTVPAACSEDRSVFTKADSSGEMDIAMGDNRSLTPADHFGSTMEVARNMTVQGDMHGDMNIVEAINNNTTIDKLCFTANSVNNNNNTVINNNTTIDKPCFTANTVINNNTGPVHCTSSLSADDVSGYNQLKDHSEAEIQLGSAVFTPTASFRHALRELLDHRMVILTGPQASGKTSIATALLRQQQGDWTPLVLQRFAEFRNHVSAGRRQVVLLDDIFGDEFSSAKFKKWSKALEVLMKFCKRGDCLAVINISDGVMSDPKARCYFDTVLSTCPFVQMQSMEPFTRNEKAALMNKHLQEAGKTLSPSLMAIILQFDTTLHMFPNCCRRFAQTALSTDDVKQTFLTSQRIRQRAGGRKVVVRLVRYLLLAAMADDVRVVKALLVHDFDDVNAANRQQWTALHYASYAGWEEIVNLLLEKGAFIDVTTLDGWSAIHLAASKGHLPVLHLLLRQKATLHGRTLSGWTPLHVACSSGLLSVIRALVEAGADPQAVDREGRTPLHVACFNNCPDIAEFLVESTGASLEATDKLKKSALHVACEEDNAKMVQLLIDKGAHSHTSTMFDNKSVLMRVLKNNHVFFPKAPVYSTQTGDLSEMTALEFCCAKCHVEVVSVLLCAAKSGDSLARALHIACAMGHHSVISVLLDSRVAADIEAENKDGMRPLHFVCINGHHQVVSLLLDSRVPADVEAETKDGMRPLHLACRYGHHQVVTLLLDSRVDADVEAENKKGWRPLHFACNIGHPQVVSLLLDSRVSAEIEAKNKDGWRPLHFACRNGHHQVVILLLYSRIAADVEAENKDGMRPLHMACQGGHYQVVFLLLEFAADVEAKNKDGMRPLHYACGNGHHQVVSLLLESRVAANVEAEDNNGWQPLRHAQLNGHKQVVSLLHSRGATDVGAREKKCILS